MRERLGTGEHLDNPLVAAVAPVGGHIGIRRNEAARLRIVVGGRNEAALRVVFGGQIGPPFRSPFIFARARYGQPPGPALPNRGEDGNPE